MDFKNALSKICKDFNKEIIFERRVISILDDYGAFKDKPYYKLFYKTVLSSGNITNLISLDRNNRHRELFLFVTRTGLDEHKVTEFLSEIMSCYHEKTETRLNEEEKNKCIDTSGESNTQIQEDPQCSHDNIINNSDITFMGVALGAAYQDFDDVLKAKGFMRGKSTYENTRYFGDFLSFKQCVVYLYWTPKTKKIYQIIIHPKEHIDNGTLKLHYHSIKQLYISKYGQPASEDTSRKPYAKIIKGDSSVEISLFSKAGASLEISYESELTRKELQTEQKIIQQEIRIKRQQELANKKQNISINANNSFDDI